VRRPRLPRGAARQVQFLLRTPPVPISVEPSPKPATTGVHYDTTWARRGPARLVRRALHEAVFEPVITVFARPETQGLDRLGSLADEPVVFAANHHSHADTPLLLRTIPEPWRHRLFVGAAADYFFPNRLTAAASALALNAIPIERTKVTRRSALDAAALIDDGWSMLIYPEGGRSPDGWAQPFRGGAAYLAIRCGVPVVPIHVEGTRHILPKGRNYPVPHKVVVTFGEPLRALADEDSRTMAARIEAAVATLADEQSSDWWSARQRFHAQRTPALGGPEAAGWRRAWQLSASDRSDSTRRRWPQV